MCGIAVLAQLASTPIAREGLRQTLPPDCNDFLVARGPDRLGIRQVECRAGAVLSLAASLLQLRGVKAVSPPLADSKGNVLLFNGEVFGGLQVEDTGNDAAALLEALAEEGADIVSLLSQLHGPWALAYWDASTDTLWFGRDMLGRRSLLMLDRTSTGGPFILSSVGFKDNSPSSVDLQADDTLHGQDATVPHEHQWQEVEPGLYSAAFRADAGQVEPKLEVITARHDWKNAVPLQIIAYTRQQDSSMSDPEARSRLDHYADVSLQALQRAVDIQCSCSGYEAPRQETTDCAASSGQPDLKPSKVLILFSGGVDSTLLAALAHRALPGDQPIDLCNICFDEGRSPDRLAAQDALKELACFAPTREWRLIEINATLNDMDRHRERLITLLAPSKTVMDLNIGMALWMAAKGRGPVRVLQGNKQTQGCNPDCPPSDSEAGVLPTLWAGGMEYISRARVVLLGHGADEQCAGYGRHRTKFRAKGWEGLAEELKLDMSRLWIRNMGRDDRLVADSGREGRHPFLDETWTCALLGMPLWAIADLSLPPGEGDKRILRAALHCLGLHRAGVRAKRAIQFGTRLSKQMNVRDFGSNRAANLQHAGTRPF